jgi:hypothetical protein
MPKPLVEQFRQLPSILTGLMQLQEILIGPSRIDPGASAGSPLALSTSSRPRAGRGAGAHRSQATFLSGFGIPEAIHA